MMCERATFLLNVSVNSNPSPELCSPGVERAVARILQDNDMVWLLDRHDSYMSLLERRPVQGPLFTPFPVWT